MNYSLNSPSKQSVARESCKGDITCPCCPVKTMYLQKHFSDDSSFVTVQLSDNTMGLSNDLFSLRGGIIFLNPHRNA